MMRHKLIENVFTIIAKKRCRQLVGFEVKGFEKYIFLTPENIKQNVNIDITEVEILTNCTIRADFYHKGETMFNNQICIIDNQIVKEYFIELTDSIENLRKKNAHLLKPLKKITNIYSFFKFDKHSVCIETDDDKKLYMLAQRLTNYIGLSKTEFHILIGSWISPTYFKNGEILRNGEIAKFDNVLNSLNMRLSGQVEQMHKNFEENAQPYYIASNGYDNSDDRPSYKKYGGAYGFDDDTIDIAFEGDPEIYWNID